MAREGQELTEHNVQQQRRYHELLQQTHAELTNLGIRQQRTLSEAQARAVVMAEEHARRLAELAVGAVPAEATGAAIGVTWNRLPVPALTQLVGFASDGSPLAELFRDLAGDAAEHLRDTLVAGLATGQGPREVAREVAKSLGVPRARALAITRTEYHRAYREASRLSYEQNADVVDGWVWHSATDRRTCAACWGMHGTAHPASARLDGHPQCRCVMVPRTRSWAEITGDPTLPDTRPTIEPGADLFARLSAEEQRAILGPAAYQRYQAGEIRLTDMVTQTSDQRWGSMRRPSTLLEAEANARAGVSG